MKSLQLALDSVAPERQSYECKREAREADLDSAMAEQGQAKRKRIQKLRAFREEMRCGTDLKLYAAYLVLESGALLEHPWIKSLIEVSRKRLDPRELLKMYREDPDSLKIANLKNPDQYWMPPETERTPPLESMSICAAMRALWEGGIGRRTQRCKPY